MAAVAPDTTSPRRTKSARLAGRWAEAVFEKVTGELSDGPDLLDLPGLRTVRFIKTPHDVVIQAELTVPPPPSCPACGGFLFIRNGAPTHFVKDQPALNRRARIFFRWQRYLCQVCRHSWHQPLPGVDTHSGMTPRLVTFIEQESMRMQPFARVAEAAGVCTATVRSVFADLVERLEASAGAAREFPRRVGLDECYVDGVARFVVTDLDRRRTFEILPKKDALTVARFLIQVPHPERVAVVVIDMWKPYRELVREFLPRAVIVVDKFHVLKKANEAVMVVRRRVRDGLQPAQRQRCMTNSPERKGKGKRSRFLLLKRAHRLNEKERRTLREWKEDYPEIAAVYDLKEELYDIWGLRGRFLAERRYDAWVRKVRASPHDLRPAFHDLLRAVENWRKEVFNYFDQPYTNGQTEARNNVIKTMQRQGRGYDFETVRARMLYRELVVPPRPPHPLGAGRTPIPRPGKKPERRRPDPASPRSNVGRMRRARKKNDEFTELMCPPEGFVERFKHFEQLDLFWDLPERDDQ
jgi:transposase